MSFLRYSLFRNINIFTPKVFNKHSHKKINNSPVEDSFDAIYRFPYVPMCSVINKSKKVQLGALIISLPGSYICYLTDAFEVQIPMAVSTVGIISTIALFGIGQLFTRLIGHVYVSRNHKQVEIAYLDFWGKRKNIICDIQDIMPLNDKTSPKDFLYKIVTTSVSDKPLKINLNKGEILHCTLFEKVFKYDIGNKDSFSKMK